MSEFNPLVEPKLSAEPRPSTVRVSTAPWWQRPYVAGLSLPWLVGIVLILGLTGWYLFAPAKTTPVNRLAFQDDFEQQPAPAAGPVAVRNEAVPASDLGQFKNEVATMIGGVRTYAEVNRNAIQRLSEMVKAQGAAQQTLQQQLAEAQAQNSLLSARITFLEGRPGAMASAQRAGTPAAKARSPLTGMHVQAIQNGMAWVYWQDQTWAVSTGDRLGQVTVTGIDAPAREVRTSAGTIK